MDPESRIAELEAELSLHAARVFAAELARARAALLAYAREAKRALRDQFDEPDDPLPF